MLHQCILTSFILISISTSSQEVVLSYDFSFNKDSLSSCVENYLLNGVDPYYKEAGIATTIARHVASRFYGKSLLSRDLNRIANQLYTDLRLRKIQLFQNQQAYKPLRLFLREVLLKCDQYHTDTLLSTPVFMNEPIEISALLDYILVDWQMLLSDMIQTRNGRALLRRYAEEAIARLAIALNNVGNHQSFRFLLRSFWLARAQSFFYDDRGRAPYFRHRYTMEHPSPHTYDNQDFLIFRNSSNLSERSPEVSNADFNTIMFVHSADNPGYGEIDVFSIYDQRGTMSRAEYYLETRIDQFYRILFFFMELQVRGISTDEDDTFRGAIPYRVMPEHLQAILHDNYVYRNYLISTRSWLQRLVTNQQFQIDVGQSLSSAHVCEEDVISLFSLWIQQNHLIQKSGNVTNVTSMMITTPKYDKRKRKGSFLMDGDGKHFQQSSKTASSDTRLQESQNDNYKYYGYILYTGYYTHQLHFTYEGFMTAMMIQDKSCELIEECHIYPKEIYYIVNHL